ncbi:unnamed protein product [Meloidogyne enterolobii]|uniref:Uncharacterized protein n=1 Tax=Meloidogyne enterolobii TaxID=390850 RepID=A0ACB1AXZ0_MELEN
MGGKTCPTQLTPTIFVKVFWFLLFFLICSDFFLVCFDFSLGCSDFILICFSGLF